MQAPLAKEGPCGGSGGDEKDMNMSGVNHVVSVIVHYGACVDSVEITYDRNGSEVTTDRWGGTGGSNSFTASLNFLLLRFM